jgi:hypothetical protein
MLIGKIIPAIEDLKSVRKTLLAGARSIFNLAHSSKKARRAG